MLRVRDLVIRIGGRRRVTVVDGISFDVAAGETVAVVGESGCGKSVTALSILRLLDPPLEVASGSIELEGVDLLKLTERDLRKVRGRRIAMIFQEPMTALNPVLTVGEQVGEGLRAHFGTSRRDAWQRSIELLREVGIPDPASRVSDYPHQLSGGMRQRAMIAMALACDPSLLIADEPTTALDVTVQAQILELLEQLRAERGMSILLITHDLGVVAETAQRVVVMYAGRIAEVASVSRLFASPSHPYTQGLLHSVPSVDRPPGPFDSIPGSVPSPDNYPTGCRFHPRCAEVRGECSEETPSLDSIAAGHDVACYARRVQRSER